MIELYYTPEVISYFIYKFDLKEQEKTKLIHNIYDYEKAFIHPKYQNNKKLFIQRILEYTDYLYFKDELDNESESIKKHMKELGHDYTDQYILLKKPPLNFFFVTTRLQLLFNDKNYIRIKLRTLLKSYGYKKKSEKILRYLEKCMDFYHIQSFKANEEINIFNSDIDDMITFRINNHYNIRDKIENNKYILELINNLENFFQKNQYSISKIKGTESITYILNDYIKISCILYPTYIKTKLHIKPMILENIINSEMDIRIKNNQIIFFIHDNFDLNNFFKLFKESKT